MTVTSDTPDVVLPTSFRYFENRDSAAGKALARALSKYVTGPLAYPDAVVTELGRDRARSDPLSDAFMEAAFKGKYARDARKMVDHALDQGIGNVPNAPPELVALFAHLDTEPDWLDWDRVERGAKVFRRYGVDAFYYFGLITIDGYRNEFIHKPLILTGAYTGGSAFGRFLETCRFWIDVSEPGGLRPGGEGRKTAVTVRIMHSMIRRRIAHHPEWDGPRLGVPLSQNAQLGTLFTSFLLNEHTKKLGYLVTDDEILDHMHFWRYVGYMLGVEPSLYPETVEDWWRMAYTTILQDTKLDGPDAKMLAHSFVSAFGPTDEDSAEVRRRKTKEYHKIRNWGRFFLSAKSFTINELPDPGWRRWIPLLNVGPNLVTDVGRRIVPGYADVIDRRQRARRSAWLESHMSGQPPRFTPVEVLSR
jgi:mpaB/rubber oxygenase-like protein